MKDKLITLYRYTYRSSPSVESNRKMFWLCFFLGIFGAHRYLMGYKWLGVWSLLDLWRLYSRSLTMANGTPLNE
jgi:hypothetical protein